MAHYFFGKFGAKERVLNQTRVSHIAMLPLPCWFDTDVDNLRNRFCTFLVVVREIIKIL